MIYRKLSVKLLWTFINIERTIVQARHCYHPPGQPPGQVQAFGPGDGELFEAVLSWGYGNLCDYEFQTKENENYTKDKIKLQHLYTEHHLTG